VRGIALERAWVGLLTVGRVRGYNEKLLFFRFVPVYRARREVGAMLSCMTLKIGKPCVFMTKSGCSYNGGRCHPVVDACDGCGHVEIYDQVRYCKISAEPASKWSMGPCNMATHAKTAQKVETPQKLNPLKASKRSQR